MTAIQEKLCKTSIFDGLAKYGKEKYSDLVINFTSDKEVLNYIIHKIMIFFLFVWDEETNYKLKAQNNASQYGQTLLKATTANNSRIQDSTLTLNTGKNIRWLLTQQFIPYINSCYIYTTVNLYLEKCQKFKADQSCLMLHTTSVSI